MVLVAYMCDTPEHYHGVLKCLTGWQTVVCFDIFSNFVCTGIHLISVLCLQVCQFLLFLVYRLPCPMHQLQ